MLTHFRELLRFYRKTILLTSFLTGAFALILSMLLLRAMPIYESSVTLNMQPSVEELQFNRGFLGVSQFNPATIIAQTHVETFLSRPIAARAVDKLIDQNGGNLPSEPPTAFGQFRAAVFQWIRILNFGYFTPLPDREIYITDLISATEIEIVEGSYILMVSISYTDPVIAARAANALAEAYIEQRQVDFAEDADRVDETIELVRGQTEARLLELIDKRSRIARDVGVNDVSSERTYLLEIRSSARTALQEAEIDLLQLTTRLREMQDAVGKEGDAGIARQLRQSIVEIRAAIAAAEARKVLRQDNWQSAEQALANLSITEAAFREVDQLIADARSDLSELQERAIQVQLAREARLSQVRIISDAQVPVYPKFPKVMFNTIIGLIVGAILVLVPISAADVLGDRMHTTEDMRGSFGSRVMPSITRRILRQARVYLSKGGRPPRQLQVFAELVGRVIAANGPRKWPSDKLSVTSMNSSDSGKELAHVMMAVVKILDRKQADGSPLEVEVLPPVSMIGDWDATSRHHVIIAVRAGENLRNEVDSIAKTTSDTASTFAALVQ